MERDDQLLVVDYFSGADGPSILIEASVEGIAVLLEILVRAEAGGPGTSFELVDRLMAPSSSVGSFEIRVSRRAPTKQLMRTGTAFVWEQSADGWSDSAALLAGLLQCPGHQYLAGGAHDDARIELSVGEHHGLAG